MALTTLPPEIFEIILTFLDLDSVKALRLTERSLAERCIGRRLLTCIQQPILDISLHNLRSLYALGCNPALKKKIHSLTFLATSLDSTKLENIGAGDYKVTRYGGFFQRHRLEGLSIAKADLEWIKEQQKARAEESSSEIIELLQRVLKRFGKLDAIHLDGAFIAGRSRREPASSGPWYPLWMRASHIFYLVKTAIVQSQCSVKKFDAFRSNRGCCVPLGDITNYAANLTPQQLTTMSKDLESFELSMSGRIQNPHGITDEDEEGDEDEETDENTTSGTPRKDKVSRQSSDSATLGITSLLKPAAALQELNLSFRRTSRDGKFKNYDRIIDAIAQEMQFPMLEKCAFYGLPAKEESILLFLQKHPNLRSFTLHECSLTTGSWTPIFSHLEESMPKLENVELSNLFGKHMQGPKHTGGHASFNANNEEEPREFDGLVNLHPIWDTEIPPRWSRLSKGGGRYLQYARIFNREELNKGLAFWAIGVGRPLGSPETLRWSRERMALYGPP